MHQICFLENGLHDEQDLDEDDRQGADSPSGQDSELEDCGGHASTSEYAASRKHKKRSRSSRVDSTCEKKRPRYDQSDDDSSESELDLDKMD